MRKTKIICTLGPASDTEEVITKLIDAGMNVARLNFSHGTHEEQKQKFDLVRKISAEKKVPVAMLLDTKGPEIRLRDFETGRILLERDQKFTLTTRDIMGTKEIASVTYKNLPEDVSENGTILIDDGLIELHIDKIDGTEIECTVVNGGPVSNHKGVNIPGTDLSMPFISAQDRADIEFGCAMGFDYIAASFTRTAEDVREIRYILNEHGSDMKIIAKIESIQGVNNLEAILDEADGIMVARGDLGVEVPLETVPVLQKQMIKTAEKKGKIVVTATQMLDSMMHNPRPTRAETTDVANAIYDGTTAIMLSGETASGAYPVEAVETMSRIAERAEQDIDYVGRFVKKLDQEELDTTNAICRAACTLSSGLSADAIITVTISGRTARELSSYKPALPVVACTTDQRMACQMNLLFGVSPIVIDRLPTADLLFEAAINAAKKNGLIRSGQTIVLTAGVPLGISGKTNMIRVIEVW